MCFILYQVNILPNEQTHEAIIYTCLCRFAIMKEIYLLCALMCVGWLARSQIRPQALDVNVQCGKILQHTEKFIPKVEHASWAIEANLIMNPDTSRPWQHTFRLPQTGIALSARRYGNDQVLGYGYGIMPFIHLPLFRTKHSELQVRIATGISLLSKHYNVKTNPENNVIASMINNITNLGLRFQTQLNQYDACSFSATFTHYSTGDARLPNLGINVPSFSLGYVHYFKPHQPLAPGKTGATAPYLEKHIIKRIKASTARFEAFRPNALLYAQFNIEAALGKQFSAWNTLYVASDIYYNSFAYHFIIHQELEPIKKAFWRSCGASVMLEDEFKFGRAGVLLAWAYEFYHPYLSGGDDYQRIGVQYDIISKSTLKTFLGVYLKTHWANADLVAAGIGVEW